MFHGLRPQETEHHFQRERMLIAQRKHQSVVGRRGLQFEIEGPAEALAQRQSPRPIDARPERRMDHELHAAALRRRIVRRPRRLRSAPRPSARAPRERIRRLAPRPRDPDRIRASATRPRPAAPRSLRAVARLRATARASGPALRRARTESTAPRRAHPPRERAPAPRAGCARMSCPAERYRRPGSRPRNLHRAMPTTVPSGSATT